MTNNLLDIEANRNSRKWTRLELLGRFAWEMTGVLFSLSPRQFWGWRNVLLRLFGATVGRGVRIHPTAKISVPWNLEIGDFAAVGDGAIVYNLGLIRVGSRATISQYAHLCAGTHDYSKTSFPLVKETISVGEGAWIAANAFVGPGVKIGPYAILGAGAVAHRHLPEWTIWGGNPAVQLKERALPAD